MVFPSTRRAAGERQPGVGVEGAMQGERRDARWGPIRRRGSHRMVGLDRPAVPWPGRRSGMVVRYAGGARDEAGRRGPRGMRRRRSLQEAAKRGGSTPDWEAACRWEKAAGHGGAAISCSPPQEPALPPRPHRNLHPDCRCLSSSVALLAPNTVAAPQSPCCPNPPGSSGRSESPRPARDRVIDFGKYKGQMLGTLPPTYLRWVVAELDYGDTAHWARLEHDVLDNPVYVDRVEWEHAHRFLRGDANYDYAYDDVDDDGPLQEMTERFGWDLSDEDGWGRLDLRLIGTSYGGRIPRKGDRSKSSSSRRSSLRGDRKGSLFDAGADQDGPRRKRDERRERMRMRRKELPRTAKMDMLGVNGGVKDAGALGAPKKARIEAKAKKDILGLGRGSRTGEALGERVVPGKGGEGGSSFPGRQSFLDKVRKLKDGS